jgi:Sec7-like guanine-nucleotide exchange factor
VPTLISALQEFSNNIEIYELPLDKIKSMGKSELDSYYKSIKKRNAFFEKTHDKFQSQAYFNDTQLKTLFKSISKRLNTAEILSYRYLMQDMPVEKTPEYIKDGLAKLCII